MKVSTVQIIRRVSQCITFIFFASLFSLALNGFQRLYTMLVNNNFIYSNIQSLVVPMALVVILSVLFGRIFCGWFCAFGAFNDFLFFISKKLFKSKFSINKALDSKLKYLKYIILGLIVVFTWTLNVFQYDKFDPWIPFAQVRSIFDGGFSINIAFFILLLVIIGAMFIERFFCRYLCPLGAMLAILSKLKLTKIKKPRTNCNKCRLCTVTCPMDIDLNSMDEVNSGECISCYKCTEGCPKKNARVNILLKSFDAVACAIAAIMIFVVSNFVQEYVTSLSDSTSTEQTSNHNTTSSTDSKAGKVYKNGVYEGTAFGFRSEVKVAVTIKGDKITDVQVKECNDDEGFKDRPIEIIPQEVIKAQNGDVDVVSGATYTSTGIIKAVQAALKSAKL